MVTLAWWALSPHAWATSAGQGLPLEAPIQKLQQSLCGPIAFGISLCSAIAAFGAIIFLGHMLGEFVRTCLYIALCISILAAAPGFATALGISGATVVAAPVDGHELFKRGCLVTGMLCLVSLASLIYACWRTARSRSKLQRDVQGRPIPRVGR